ncbi:NAD(P)H-hydrate epimerase [Spiroplasma citri]|nr:NAD(P)H-hydrate epimerase [Spiroplasma citri]
MQSPSGIENDSATIPTIAIKANKTVTFLFTNQLLLIMILFFA